MAMGVGGGLCRDCLIDIILEVKTNIYPISVKELERKWKKKN
jgi:hypothetical protein